MKFTFGICTIKDSNIKTIIDSIKSQNNMEYEIIIKSGDTPLTVKKNTIAKEANFENIVFMHDYVELLPNWYEGWIKFGNDYKIAMNIILDYYYKRYRDWCLWYVDIAEKKLPIEYKIQEELMSYSGMLLPYDINISKWQYISGMYWIAKKYIMLENPLNEYLNWGMGEDVEWSKRVREKYKFSMNTNSKVRILKPEKIPYFQEMLQYHVEKIKHLGE